MNFLIDNWYVLIAIIAVIAVAAIAVYSFIKQPRSKQIAKVQEWLLWAVVQAEKQFGSKTGQIKLRYVYDLFITRFPFVAKVLPFETFSSMVDIALEKMRKLLESNKNIESYVEGE